MEKANSRRCYTTSHIYKSVVCTVSCKVRFFFLSYVTADWTDWISTANSSFKMNCSLCVLQHRTEAHTHPEDVMMWMDNSAGSLYEFWPTFVFHLLFLFPTTRTCTNWSGKLSNNLPLNFCWKVSSLPSK